MKSPDDMGSEADPVAEVNAWLEASWDPAITVKQWWERLGVSGWSAPGLPVECGGRGLSREDSVRVQRAIADYGALGAPGGLGLLLAAPTIAVHGSPAQREKYLPDILTGRRAWCQLFSEPNAGSDLAGLQTRAERDGDEWVVTGQKVWTSGGQIADLAMLLARTDPDVPKHQGISYFAFDMRQPGVEVRPLREMTGRSMFNEVFISEARVGADAVIGGLGNGWKVANTTLQFERAGLGAGGGTAAGGAAMPGTIAGDLDKPVAGFLGSSGRRSAQRAGVFSVRPDMLIDLARRYDALGDPVIRQGLAQLYTLGELARFTNLRQKALHTSGQEIPGLGNMAKLAMSAMLRLARDLGLGILGPYGALHAYGRDQRADLDRATGRPETSYVTELALFAQGPSIYGGTDEIQHNILGERVLGLPREPSDDRQVPFRDLPRNG